MSHLVTAVWRPLWLVGIDGGLANFGISRAEVLPDGKLRFHGSDVWTSKPASKARRLRKADDEAERIAALTSYVHAVLVELRPVAVCIESKALPFGRCRSSVVSALGRVRGVVDALCHIAGIPVLEETPQRLKIATAGTASASKADVQTALVAMQPELSAMLPVSGRDHAADSCAAIVACRSADVVLAALRAREGVSS